MHLFLKTLYMLTVMVMTGIMMLLVLLCTPDFHTRLSSGFYRQTDLSYSQFVMQSLDNPGIYVAEVAEDLRVDAPEGAPVKRETAWDYRGNNSGYLKIHIDYARPQHEPWAGTDCMGVRVAFARRRTLPRTALASFPGSGNTWLRYLIQSTTGIFTGSVYNDPQLASKGFYGENETPECGCTIVVKTHGYSLGGRPESRDKRLKEMNKFFGRGLLLVRNPFDTLIAYRNFLSAGHLGVAGPTAFRGPAWDRFVRNEIELWKSYAVDWITLSRSSHVVHYEHLLGDPKRELLKILHFLRIRVENRRFQCVLKNLNGAFKRTTPNGVYYRLRDPYTPEQHRVIESAMREVDQALMQHGWPPLPMHLYSYNYENFTSDPVSHQDHHTNRRQPPHQPQSQLSNQPLGKGVLGGDQENEKRLMMKNKKKMKTDSKGQLVNDSESNVIKLSPWMKNR
ncbi:WSC domain-containing protein 1-like [Penaeus japonicus]|uniref:WSC domain-containing protein 1-like n=1 Tax=Penaeus japonicus TaxID=27405 RepID=UPI001C7160B0|nr:WSC domain-containing protein 1-like [Penaeus japonicus]